MTLVKIKDNKVVIAEPKVPELDKQLSENTTIQTIRNFLGWLVEEWVPAQEAKRGQGWEIRIADINRHTIINEYLGLDERKMDNERWHILACQRIHNANNDLREDKKVKAMKTADRELYIHGKLLEVEKKECKELGVK